MFKFLENTPEFTGFSEPDLVSRALRHGSTFGMPKAASICTPVKADDCYGQKTVQITDNRQEQSNSGQLHIENYFWAKDQNLTFGADGNANESRKKSILSIIYTISISLMLCMSFSSAYAAEEGKDTKTIKNNKSLLIIDRNILNQLNTKYNFLYQLGNVAHWLDEINEDESVSPGAFVSRMFGAGHTEQISHNQGDNGYKIGVDVPEGRMFDRIFKKWKPKNEMKSITDAKDLKEAPFRLTAIVNRMDLAGTIDDRGLQPTTEHPRSLGELHLVYTYVDDDYEGNHGEAYPQTWVLSYRLPLLKKESNGDKYVIDKNLLHESVIVDNYLWKPQMKQWADLWIKLSDFKLNDKKYKRTLSNILELVTDPENFLNVRSNTKLNNNEFELREFYILQSKTIIARKPKREPYKCLDKSALLTHIIEDYWNYDYASLDETTHTIKANKPEAGVKIHQKGQNGYTITRDVNRVKGFQDPDSFGVLPNIDEHYSECLKDGNKPFEMVQSPDGPGNTTYDRLVSPFARVTKKTLWKVPTVSEAKRHSFAMKTCSGCHSREGATYGFHIKPRLKKKNAQLSPFLTGKGYNKFKYNNTSYQYNELARRKAWLIKFHHQEANLFDSLKTDL